MRLLYRQPDAKACIKGEDGAACLHGSVRFYQLCDGVLVEADICGLPENSVTGIFAMHIHEGSDCRGKGFPQTGSHYDPHGQPHPRHAGDLPPLFACKGNAYLAVLTDRFCLADVLGRTVVIHSGADDFTTQPAGNSGKKIACGVICAV